MTAIRDDQTPERPDDWDQHWTTFGSAADSKPASLYRQRLMLKWLGSPGLQSTVLDIGSGQGEFAVYLKEMFPLAQVWGVEHSGIGVARSKIAADNAGVEVSFIQRDLLGPVALDPGQLPATHAVCSEVLEHVDDPTQLLRNAVSMLAPGCRVVITVPGGPRSSFDRHIGHRRHFTASALTKVVSDSGLAIDQIRRAGVPFFNLYKTASILRGKRLIADTEGRAPGASSSRLEGLLLRFFDLAFRLNLDDAPLGWQLIAIAHVPAAGA